MTISRDDELNGGMQEAVGTVNDSNEPARKGTNDQASPAVQAADSVIGWYYYHVSTP